MISIVRHMESEFNKTNIDNINCGITEKGKDDAKKLSGHYDLVLVSPLKRCQETLQYSNITYDQKIIVDLLREYKVNRCDFLENEEIIFEIEKEIIMRINEFKTLLRGIFEGIVEGIKIKGNYKDIKILVISHGDFIWYLTSEIEAGERFGQWLENGEMIDYLLK
jgi:broad specificity phosphatase PhoE